MLVRIRLGEGPAVQRKKGKNRHVALAFGALLAPVSVMPLALAAWEVAAEQRWTAEFPISSGLFAGWEAWIGTAIALQLCALALNRYGRGNPAESEPGRTGIR